MKRAWKVIHLVGDDDPIDVVSDDEAVGHVLNDNTIDLTGKIERDHQTFFIDLSSVDKI